MNVLWIVNGALPCIAQDIGMESRVFEGWLVGLSNQLKMSPEIKLMIACPQNIQNKTIEGETNGIKYSAYPRMKKSIEYDEIIQDYIVSIINDTKPDVIHIMGTEYPHSYSAIMASKRKNMLERTVVSIQGLVSVYAQHFDMGIPSYVQNRVTIKEYLKRTSLEKEKNSYISRGVYEVKTLQECKHIIGRTDWDKACTYFINPFARYHFNNETLRASFYEGEWSIEKCEKHSLFVSQGNKPIKGFHFVLEALHLVKSEYKDVKLYLAGSQQYKEHMTYPRWKRTSYENYIMDLIDKYDLFENIVFCGSLDENSMRDQYLRSHVFISASTIENSPNSVGEAMLLGVPVVTSDVGGVKNLMTHGKEGLVYPMDEPYMMAYYIMGIFGDDCLAKELSRNARTKALHTHDRSLNAMKLVEIYKEIVAGDRNEE